MVWQCIWNECPARTVAESSSDPCFDDVFGMDSLRQRLLKTTPNDVPMMCLEILVCTKSLLNYDEPCYDGVFGMIDLRERDRKTTVSHVLSMYLER